jgi:hypothetical protein
MIATILQHPARRKMTAEIPLSTQKRRNSKNLGLVALVADDDDTWLRQWNWNAVSTQRLNDGCAMRRVNQAGKTILSIE